MKNQTITTLLAIIIVFSLQYSLRSQVNTDLTSIWAEMIELDQSLLLRHVLNDLPGAIVVLRPDGKGGYNPEILGRKVLKSDVELPDVVTTPTLLIEDIKKKEIAITLSYLSMATASMEDNEQLRFSVTETAHTSIVDNDVNWDSFDDRVASYLANPTKYPPGTLFGVVRVASIIVIDHQKFVEKKKAADINGWGFSANGKVLSESSQKNVSFKVGVALTYSDQSSKIYAMNNPSILEVINKNIESAEGRASIIKEMNQQYAKRSSTMKAISE